MNRGLGLGLVAGMLALACPAAATDYEVQSIRVDASALDLSTNAGISLLSQRINRAVNRICGSDRYCRDEAWASTEGQVAWAIDRDRWMRLLARERAAQLSACGWSGCGPEPVYAYPAPPPPPAGRVTVTIVCPAPAFYAARW
ncbi:UrcA family protein [Sphingomonas sp. IC-56]|uniref:UrcA family protein n=1 Tax=Sphingomonas sp. IC-56 TaxID=2898529 RepID=UPI001E5505BA|nr:UrcA family protein [Sphingomonas sp. IC-56]MCD2324118.1 UrcA family protein [Sphingomonas sp. IC-56]